MRSVGSCNRHLVGVLEGKRMLPGKTQGLRFVKLINEGRIALFLGLEKGMGMKMSKLL